jgi:CheY-like chemotaxis protein
LGIGYTKIMTELQKPKILLAEDDDFMIQLLSDAIIKDGFVELFVAKNGEEALAVFKKERPVLCLVDILMPLKNGIEFIEDVRALPEGKDTIIVVLSNLSDPRHTEDAERLGVSKYFIKANTLPGEIVAEIKKLLGIS